MLSGSLVTGDTLSNLFTRGAYNGYGYADEVVYTQSATGAYQFFNISLAHGLYQSLYSSSTAGPYVRGVTPEILSAVTVNDTTKAIIQSGVTLIGTYGNASQALGDFHASDGSINPYRQNEYQAIVIVRDDRDLNASIVEHLRHFLPIS